MDTSSEGNTVSIGAGTPKIQPFSPFAPSSAYNASVKGGSANFSQLATSKLDVTDASDFDFGTGDFTVEAWVYPTKDLLGGGAPFALMLNGKGYNFYIGWTTYSSAGLVIYGGQGVGSIYSGSTDHVPQKYAWSHIVYQNTSGNFNFYLNGTRVCNVADSGSFPDVTGVTVGVNDSYGSYYLGADVSDLRVVKGSNVYSNASTLTVPTAPLTSVTNTKLLLNFTNAAIFDQTGKTNVQTSGDAQLDTSYKKFGTASAEFDGTAYGDRLVISNYDVAPVGTQSFTVECFIYVGNVSNYRCIYSAGYGIQIYIWTDSKVQLYIGNAAGGYDVNGFQSTSTISINTWTHIAVVRDSPNSTLTIFINGTASGQTSVTTDIPKLTGVSDYQYVIGAYSNGNYTFSGYIDEMRITNKARYTSNFTAPTKEFPNR